MEDLYLIAQTVFQLALDFFGLLTSNWLLNSVLALWLVRRVAKIFQLI